VDDFAVFWEADFFDGQNLVIIARGVRTGKCMSIVALLLNFESCTAKKSD
jgi:hypothetical protein